MVPVSYKSYRFKAFIKVYTAIKGKECALIKIPSDPSLDVASMERQKCWKLDSSGLHRLTKGSPDLQIFKS